MTLPESYPFTIFENAWGERMFRPILPFQLYLDDKAISINGLLDTGADVNILPYNIGLQIGGKWSECPIVPSPAGNVSRYETRGLAVNAVVGNFPPVRLAFAWMQSENVPLLLGQVNFFMQFDVCFFRASNRFEIRLKDS